MASCDRCGRSTDDGATVDYNLDLEARLCVVCQAWYDEHEIVRELDQASLEDY